MLYKNLVKKVSVSPELKTKQKNYLEKGILPIIDQGQEIVGGYTDNLNLQLPCSLPVIVFGDHTRAVKYIDFPFGAGADGIKVLQPKEYVLPKFLYYATQYLVLRLEDRGYARHYQYIEKKELNIPDIEEQKLIVVKIEELFSQLDSAVETLKKTKQQLAVYRQAVLKEAFEGTLTNCKRKALTPIGMYIDKPRYGTSKKCVYNVAVNSTPVYRIPNINHAEGRICHKDIKYATFNDSELVDLKLEIDDILIIRSNGSVSLVGKAAIIKDVDIGGTFAGYLMRLRINKKSMLLPAYLLHYLQSYNARTYIENVAKSTSGVHNVNSTEISALKIPIFDLIEQQHIVLAIENRISVCDSIEKTVDTALQQAEAMRQSILKKAFEGKL